MLAYLLRRREGADRVGVGPDVNQLLKLWGENDPLALRPAIEELEKFGFLRVDRGMPNEVNRVHIEYKVRDIAGVAITERFQEHCDRLGF